MKKIFLIIGLFVFSMTTSISELYAACSVTKGKIIVNQGGGSKCSSIQDAMLVANGSDLIVIEVWPGTYTEAITMKSNVHLKGAGRDVTKISIAIGAGGIEITNRENVEISGFTIENSVGNDGIYLSSSSPIIRDNKFGGSYGIGMDTASAPEIFNNKFESTSMSIWVDASSPTIRGNNFIVQDTGLEISSDSNSIIKDNVFKGTNSCEMGIRNRNSNAKIIGNIMTGMGCYGIYNKESSSTEIIGNSITGDGDLLFLTYATASVSGNIISGSPNRGFYVDNNSSVSIINNKVVGNAIDMNNAGCTDCNFSFNVFDSFQGFTPSSLNVKSDGTPYGTP